VKDLNLDRRYSENFKRRVKQKFSERIS